MSYDNLWIKHKTSKEYQFVAMILDHTLKWVEDVQRHAQASQKQSSKDWSLFLNKQITNSYTEMSRIAAEAGTDNQQLIKA